MCVTGAPETVPVVAGGDLRENGAGGPRMPKIIVLGGGLCGLAAGILLARDGHEVTVLERDPEPVPASPDEAWEAWARGGVAQFRQPHFLQARVRHVLETELPHIRDGLLAAGAVRVDPIERLPPSITDRTPRPDDERLVSISARRPTTELVFARAAEAEPGLVIRRGIAVEGLVTARTSDVPHVTGVRTAAGETVSADLVVDAMGRRSPLPRWLRDAGADPVLEEAEDCGFVYYTRFFRPANGEAPEPRTGGLLTPIGSFSILTLPGEHGTWSVTLFVSSHDRPLKVLRHEDRWAAVVSACPLHAHWLDGDPITGVLPMGGVIDRYRRLRQDGRPIATGIALVADAWACTNPSLARGVALGLHHVARLRDAIRSHLDDPRGFAAEWDAVTEAEFTPWYRATIATDRARLAEIDSLRTGVPVPAPADPAAALRAAFPLAMQHDPDLFRAFMEIVGCLALPQDVLTRPGLAERVLELAANHEAPPPPGPTRDELLRLLD
jgi:2-polyprenyl-6-methoxyphenol hydroxylase-like FAD-dependent oxidoreductase